MSSLPLPRATPEDIGLSTAGLARLGRVMQDEVQRGRVPGSRGTGCASRPIGLLREFRPPRSGEQRADGEGQHLSHLFDDQTHRFGGGHDAVGGRTIPAERSRR